MKIVNEQLSWNFLSSFTCFEFFSHASVWIRSLTIPNSLIPGLSFFVSCLIIGLGTSLLMTIIWIIAEPIVFEVKRRRNLEPLHFKLTALGYYWGQFFSVTNTCANSRRWEGIAECNEWINWLNKLFALLTHQRFAWLEVPRRNFVLRFVPALKASTTGTIRFNLNCVKIFCMMLGLVLIYRHNHIYKIPVPRSCIDSANQFILNFQAQGLHPANQFNASVWDDS